MALRIHSLEDRAAPAWDAFVQATPAASFFHLSPWARVIREAFGHTTHYAYAERDGSILGVLPLARMRTRLFGDSLASTPFCVYGGAVAVEEEARLALEAHALDLQKKLSIPCLEYRRLEAADPGWQGRPPLYFTFRKPIVLTGDDAKDMQKNIPRKQRAEVRKAIERFKLTSVSDGDTDRLHRIYAESVRNLGSPVFPRRYFRLLGQAFPGAHDVTTVLHEGRPVAAVLNFHFRDQVLPYYGGGTRDARGLSANDFMYWEVMRRAGNERGATLFDFGRSKAGTGAFAYKRNWGFTEEELHYCYRLAPGAAIPENNPNNPKYKLVIAAWKKLPLAVANILGPPLVRGLG
ncbi:FemAB family PEP-CTERM system-associated protein [Siccirubricoccus sp. KC 17139]|uniref:FemAB family PEP-CTERM system-associated protein n=1 Tax=Siccirubricoccus soli TaxID=2899147 RepID=A0ABT1DCW7_9PROT|nr:FemAB family XrtA/PEP-CTERM system-associated protein [Siccirubricoccus soli]MCO6419787.1 FemAB family PEP-CTERM system-associated protein [Siccirubricoccus soli]MCP2685922.1 FemAB family PEP-CTERM system-associated protein [Siccirubricoccus soli]